MKKSYHNIILFLVCLFSLFTSCSVDVKTKQTKPQEIIETNDNALTLEAIESGVITLTNPWSTLKYKINNGSKQPYTDPINVSSEDKVYFYADGSENTENKFFTILCSGDCYIYGNIMSLCNSTDFENKTSLSKTYYFSHLFYNNTHIKNHDTKDLLLPAITLNSYCYEYLFCGCTGLTSAFNLPSNNLRPCCYAYMFSSCTNLKTIPTITFTQIGPYSCFNMFSNCTSLESTPSFSIIYTNNYSYKQMFYNCTNLKTILITFSSPQIKKYCFEEMFCNCTSIETTPAFTTSPVAEGCYKGMFKNCTGLLSSPDIKIQQLKSFCFEETFCNCTSLQKSPKIITQILSEGCFKNMFSGCTNLNEISCSAEKNINATDCFSGWVNNVASKGIINLSSYLFYEYIFNGNSKGIVPSGWQVKETS